MTDAHQVVAAYWAAAEARDWETFGRAGCRAGGEPGPAVPGASPGPGGVPPVCSMPRAFLGEWHIAGSTDCR